MDKINEILAWFTLALSWWLYKREYIGNDKDEPEKVADAMSIVSDEPRPLTCGQFQSELLNGESIISSGLSDLMRKKYRLTKGRRAEDRQASEQ